MGRSINVVAFAIIVVFLVLAVILTPINSGKNMLGFASSPLYSGYAVPIGGMIVDSTLNFATSSDSVQKSLDVSDYIVYRRAYVSYDGQAWVQFNLTPTNTATGDWIYGRGISNITFSPSVLHLNSSRTSSNNTFIIIYSCSKNTTLKAWDCHGGWQILQFNAKLTAASSGAVYPSIAFISPTPNNSAVIKISSQEIVANILDDSNAVSSWIDFDNSLIGYWSMDYYSSIGIYDNSTYKNFAFFNGGLSTNNIVTGVRGKGLYFGGSESDYLSMGDKFDLGVQSWSYSFWLKEVENNRMYILEKGATSGYNGIRIETDIDQKGSAIFGGISSYKVVYGPNILLNDGSWHNIVVVFNRSGNGIWYTDGVAGNPVDISSYSNENIDVSDDFVISGGWNTYLKGTIDEVMIFDRALSSSEVKALYDSKANKFDATLINLANGQHNYTVYAIDGIGAMVYSVPRNFIVSSTEILSCSGSSIQSCTGSIANAATAIQTRTCNFAIGQWSLFGTCTITSCNSGYHISDNICVIDSVNNSYSGTVYYVSSSFGSDSNDGLSESKPWKTVSHVNSQTFKPGDAILFKSGDTWREQIIPKGGNVNNYIYYSSYGTGVKPLFLGSVQANSLSDWVNLGGNIWQNSNSAFSTDVGNIIFDDETKVGVKIMSAAPTLDTQGEFWYDHVNHKLQIYSIGNPASVYRNIECVLSNDAIYGSKINYIVFQNLDFRYWGKCVRQDGGDYVKFLDLDISYIGGADSGSNGGSWYTERFGNGLQLWEGTHDITIERCKIDNIYDAGISPQGYAGGFEAYNIFIRNNIITNCEYNYEFYERDNTAYSHDIYFEHNTCAFAGKGWGHTQRPDGGTGKSVRLSEFTSAKSNIYIRNNIFYDDVQANFVTGLTSDLNDITLDYNLYYQPGGGWIGYEGWTGTSFSTLAAWKIETGQEAHAVSGDPLFIDAANGDFHLKPRSPAIDTGMVIPGSTTDYDGKSWNNPPSIGAYEYP